MREHQPSCSQTQYQKAPIVQWFHAAKIVLSYQDTPQALPIELIFFVN